MPFLFFTFSGNPSQAFYLKQQIKAVRNTVHTFVIIRQYHILIGHQHQTTLEYRFGKSAQHTKGWRILRIREVTGFTLCLFLERPGTFHAATQSSISRITPCGLRLNASRLKHFSRMKKTTVTFFRFLLLQIHYHHIFREACLHIKIIHIRGITIPHHFRIIKAAPIPHQ